MFETIGKYLSNLKSTGLEPPINVFRGQSDSRWTLTSSATRRLTESEVAPSQFPFVYTSYHQDILVKARTGGFSTEYGQDLSDLQLLAELQHLGAATGLLDFTWNPLVALWFASDDSSKDGKLFVINTNNPGNVYRILGNEENQEISRIFLHQLSIKPSVSIWEPTLRNTAKIRMLVQRSVLVIGPPEIANYDDFVSEITIEQKDKAALRSELYYLDISQLSLFRDIFGFTQAHGVKSKIFDQPTAEISITTSRFMQGITLYQQGDYHGAVNVFDAVIKLDKSRAEYYFYRGIASMEIDDYSKAVENLDYYIERVTDNHLAYNIRGLAKYKQQRFEEAIEDYNEAINHKGNHALAYHNRGVAWDFLEQYENSIRDYDRAIELEPMFCESYYNRARVKILLKQSEEAVEDCTEVLRLNPEDYIEAYRLRADAYCELEKYGVALQDLNYYIRLAPDDVEAYRIRSDAYYMLGKYEATLQDLNYTIRLNPNYDEAYFFRSDAYYMLGKYEAALQDLNYYIRLAPDEVEAYKLRACAYCELEEFEVGLQDLNYAIRLEPNHYQAYYIKAHVNKMLGRYEEAEKDLKIAYRLNPELKENSDSGLDISEKD